MGIFVTLLFKLVPLYCLILLGFLCGKFLNFKKEIIASLLFYTIIPVVLFTGIIKTNIDLGTLSIPLLFFFIPLIVSMLTYYISGFIWKDSTRNILTFISGTGNIGYFGLPVAVALFGENSIGIVALGIFGISFYTDTLGYFIAAKGHHTTKESLVTVLKLPMLYALIIGLIMNILDINLPKTYFDLANIFTFAFTILGMMLIGIGLADIKDYKFDLKFIGMTFLSKFIFWPLIMLIIIIFDTQIFHLYSPAEYKVLMLLAIVPVGANIVSYTTILKSHPEKASLAVFISTIFALFYIPLIAFLFF